MPGVWAGGERMENVDILEEKFDNIHDLLERLSLEILNNKKMIRYQNEKITQLKNVFNTQQMEINHLKSIVNSMRMGRN
jgi:hypothetical protein